MQGHSVEDRSRNGSDLIVRSNRCSNRMIISLLSHYIKIIYHAANFFDRDT